MFRITGIFILINDPTFQACAGLLADARALVKTARTEAADYRAQYKVPIPIKVRFSYHTFRPEANTLECN